MRQGTYSGLRSNALAFTCCCDSHQHGSNQLEVQGLTGIWIGEEGADGQQHFADSKRRAPLVLQNVKANLAVAIDVAVIDARPEHNLRHACMDIRPVVTSLHRAHCRQMVAVL